ncbi:MAG TPA: 2,5-diamino-6-(ribosylamino)-4(3H)-pyrimidinone 5'-phosphate reductase [Natrialbaceae archaeon]|nr:2,5-diamino-6-(ribosylamino)-4(3H)-pyrimidinone 5'-phosphate reductase [Natrialbaceae archaeon]
MHVRVNAAMSADGKLSTRRREQLAISGPEDFERVEDVRESADGILVGVGTVAADDPHLVLDRERQRKRSDRGEPPSPARIVADSLARMPPDARILDDAAPTYVLVGERAPYGRVSRLEKIGASVVRAGHSRVDLVEAFDQLETEGIDHLMIEGGGEIIFSAFEAGLVDELSVYVGSLIVGGRDAPTLADGEGFVSDIPDLDLDEVERIDDGVLLSYSVV